MLEHLHVGARANQRLHAVGERFAFGGVVDAVGIDPAEIGVEHLFGGGFVTAHQSPGECLVRLDHVALRRGLGAHDGNLRDTGDESDREKLFHDSSCVG
ncbi:MAG: hypothetical protein E6H78_21225 [Betaproteobacteria bacterium]|nr:MAG: hypothetical protein E6H78_21225 [Betaproteobacteria bacterium]